MEGIEVQFWNQCPYHVSIKQGNIKRVTVLGHNVMKVTGMSE